MMDMYRNTVTLLCVEVRGHCVANLDPLGITQVRLGPEDIRSKLLATYRYHEVFSLGKFPLTSYF